jgi:hypothetical protein
VWDAGLLEMPLSAAFRATLGFVIVVGLAQASLSRSFSI